MARVAQDIPKVGLVMENARLVRWLKNVGDTISQGEPILELETEKSIVEIEATVSGRLVEQLIAVDQEAHVGDRVAWVENDEALTNAPASADARAHGSPAGDKDLSGTSGAASAAPAFGGARNGASQAGAGERAGAEQADTEGGASAPAMSGAHGQGLRTGATADPTARIRSSPVGRRLAKQNGIDLSKVTGTGPRGRIQLKDVQRAIEARSSGQRGTASAAVPQELSSMRRALARSMTLSNATVPQFIVERAVDWTTQHAVRTRLNANLPAGAPKLSVNDFLLQAIARALLSFPTLNATFSGDANSNDARIVPSNGAHIGLVVAVENGLLVPVIHDVDQQGLAEIARQRTDAVDRALKGRLKREQLEGATFSISNLGARGPDRFTAIINPPQSAILAVGRQRDCVVAVAGGIHVRPMSDLSLTVDHRVADGRLASDFLAYVVEILEGEEWRS